MSGTGGGPIRLCDFVRHHAGIAPRREAIVFGAQRYSYAQLDERVTRCAAALSHLGVGRGDRVAMLTTPRPEFALVLLAAQRVGAIWVGLNPRYRHPEMSHILEDCRPRVLLAVTADGAGRDYGPDLEALAAAHPQLRIVRLGGNTAGDVSELDELIAAAGPTAGPVESAPDEDDPTVIVYTSGTTGRPKGAVLAHRNLLYCHESVNRSFRGKEALRHHIRLLCNLPPNHIGCISEMLGNTLIAGGTVIFCERFDAEEALRTIAVERVTLIGGVPVMLRMIFESPALAAADLSSVKMIGWGGAPAPRALVERMAQTGAHLFTNYGLTEGGAVVSATPPAYDLDILCNTVGFPDSSGNHRLVDEAGADVPPGVDGEIWLRGRGVFLGYWNDAASTDAMRAPGGWLRTGDIAHARADGAWVLTGRKSEMFKSGGYNIYPREIELALETHPGVAVAVVVAVRDPLYFEVGAAFVVPAAGTELSAEALRAHLRRRLANYKVPKTIHVRRELPMLPIGKIDKRALLEQAAAPACPPHE